MSYIITKESTAEELFLEFAATKSEDFRKGWLDGFKIAVKWAAITVKGVSKEETTC